MTNLTIYTILLCLILMVLLFLILHIKNNNKQKISNIRQLFIDTNHIWQDDNDYKWLLNVNVSLPLVEIERAFKTNKSIIPIKMNYLCKKWETISNRNDYTKTKYKITIRKLSKEHRGQIIISVSDLEAIYELIQFQTLDNLKYIPNTKYSKENQFKILKLIIKLLNDKSMYYLARRS